MESHKDIRDIIWDADNTIWNWVRYAARAYQAMADTIAQETGIPEPEVAGAMKRYYTSVGTLEDAGLIQGLEAQGLFKKIRNYNRDRLIEKVRAAFKEARDKNLRNYRGMRDIIAKTQQKGINNIIVTDAPKFHAQQRITRSKIHKYIKRAYAIKPRPVADLPFDVQEKISKGLYKPPFELYEIEVEKPHTNIEAVLQIMADTGEKVQKYIRDHVAIIGDNYRKDMGIARLHKCLGIHALWGQPDPADLEVLKKFAPEAAMARNVNIKAPYSAKPEPESNIIRAAKPEDLARILNL